MSTFDVVVATDLRLTDHTAAGIVDDIRRLSATDHSVGLLHRAAQPDDDTAPFAPHYRDVLARRMARLILPADPVTANLVIIAHPATLTDDSGITGEVTSKRALVVAGESPRRWIRSRYDAGAITTSIATMLDGNGGVSGAGGAGGPEVIWAPWDSDVRRALAKSSAHLSLTSFDWDDDYNRASHIMKLASSRSSQRGEAKPAGDDTPVPDRSHGVLIIDITGDDRPDILLPAVRRETTDAQRPRVVATSAEQAAEHVGDLAVETLPRTLAALDDDQRRDYLTSRIASLVRTHQPHDVIVLDDFSTGVDIRALLAGHTAKIWLVQPAGPVDLPSVDDTLGKRIENSLPPGWVVAPVLSDLFDDDESGGPHQGQPRRRSSIFTWPAQVIRAMVRKLRKNRPSSDASTPVALIVVPDVHADPQAAVRAIVSRQHETKSFRPAILAPPDWEPAAAQHGVPIETMIPEPTWTSIYGYGWHDYVRQRVRDAGMVFGASTIVFTDDIADHANVALDAVEASVDVAAMMAADEITKRRRSDG